MIYRIETIDANGEQIDEAWAETQAAAEMAANQLLRDLPDEVAGGASALAWRIYDDVEQLVYVNRDGRK